MKSSSELLANIKFQAQNLSRLKSIKLSLAYEIISWAFYHCPNYNDLRKRILNKENKSHWLKLSEINKKSDSNDLKKFETVLPILADRLSSRMICNTNRLGLTDLVYEIFGITASKNNIHMLFPTLTATEWKVVDDEEITPFTLLECYVQINKVCYRMIAVNIFMPGSWPIDGKHQEFLEMLTPFTPNEFLLCVGSGQSRLEAVNNHISELIAENYDDDSLDLFFSSRKLTDHEAKLEKDIQELLRVDDIGGWGDIGDTPIPLTFDGKDMKLNTYLVFGYPVAEDYNKKSNRWVISPDKCHINDSQVFLLGDHPITMEWISVDPSKMVHNGPYLEHYLAITKLLFSQDDFCLKLDQQNESHQLALFKPANKRIIAKELELRPHVEPNKETWLIKVENSTLAEEVIRKVCNRDIFIHEIDGNTKEIICKINSNFEDDSDLSISLEIRNKYHNGFYNLTTGKTSQTSDKKTTSYIKISSTLLNLVSIISKDEVIKSLKYGLINQVKCGTLKKVNEVNKDLIDNLPKLPKYDSDLIREIESSCEFTLDPFDLFSNTRKSQYERENY